MNLLKPRAERDPASAAERPLRDARQWRPQAVVDRYSRRVVLLKRVLPMIGGALLLLVAAWPRLSPLLDNVRLGFAAIDLREAGELKMLDPRYAGIDRLNRPYVVTAAVGRQVPNRNDLMSLEQPRAVMIVHDGAKVVLSAATGIYQSQTQLLDLFGGVTLTHQNGTRFVTSRAHADFSDNTAVGHDPIEGQGPSGDVWGQGFRILDKGDTIIFSGRSHAMLNGSRPGKAARPPPALPDAVATKAAQITAAATLPSTALASAHRSAVAARPSHAKPAATHHSAGRSHTKGRPAVKPTAGKSRVVDKPVKPEPAARKVEPDAG
jgi:lipopolysaccharide export system protein LptC